MYCTPLTTLWFPFHRDAIWSSGKHPQHPLKTLMHYITGQSSIFRPGACLVHNLHTSYEISPQIIIHFQTLALVLFPEGCTCLVAEKFWALSLITSWCTLVGKRCSLPGRPVDLSLHLLFIHHTTVWVDDQSGPPHYSSFWCTVSHGHIGPLPAISIQLL